MRLEELKADAAMGSSGGPLGNFLCSTSGGTARNMSHRSPTPTKESNIERTLRRQKLAAKMGKR